MPDNLQVLVPSDPLAAPAMTDDATSKRAVAALLGALKAERARTTALEKKLLLSQEPRIQLDIPVTAPEEACPPPPPRPSSAVGRLRVLRKLSSSTSNLHLLPVRSSSKLATVKLPRRRVVVGPQHPS